MCPSRETFQSRGSAYVTHTGRMPREVHQGVDGTTLDGRCSERASGPPSTATRSSGTSSAPTRLFVPARHGQRQRLLHERRDARQVREQTRAIVHEDATKIGANGVKTKILPAPANGSTQGRLGVTANGLPAPGYPSLSGVSPRRAILRQTTRARRGLGRLRRGSSRRARSRGFSLRRRAGSGRPATRRSRCRRSPP